MGARALGPRVLIVVITIVLLAAVYAVDPLGLPVTPEQRPIAARTPEGHALRAPMIVVAPEIVAERAAAIPLLVEVGPPQWVPHDSVLLLQGLPAGAHLSHGERLAAGIWSVPVASLPALAFALPATAVGRWQLRLRLVAAEGSFLAQAKTVIAAPALAAEQAQPSASAKQVSARSEPQRASALLPSGDAGARSPAGSRLPPQAGSAAEPASSASAMRAGAHGDERVSAAISAAVGPAAQAAPTAEPRSVPPQPQESRTASGPRPYDAGWLVERGRVYVAAGDVATARQFLLRAAEAGSARGALMLAATYDPHELAATHVIGVLPNRALAFSWYRRAQELGEALAAERLARLGSSPP